jgi:hypothetical protein
MRTALAASLIGLSTLAVAAPRCSWAGDAKASPAFASATTIHVSFRLDPRVLGPTYGGERWVAPRTYSGARAQNAVEVKARAADARGASVKVQLEWNVSDPEMLAVSPPVGERVTITAKRTGASTVTVKAGEAKRTLTFSADKPNGDWQVTLSQ